MRAIIPRIRRLEIIAGRTGNEADRARKLERLLMMVTGNAQAIIAGHVPAHKAAGDLPEYREDSHGLRRGLRVIEILQDTAARKQDRGLIGQLESMASLCRQALSVSTGAA